ncbi:MAG: ABC transporter ATP-binding protein [Eubacteriales bacterium]
MKRILRYCKPVWPLMTLTMIVKFLAAVAELFIPKILARIIDEVVPSGQKGQIYLWGGVMLLFSLFALGGNIFANAMSTKTSADVTCRVRQDLFTRISYLSAPQVDRLTVSSLVSRLTSDTYYINEMLARIQRIGVRAPILIIGGILITLTLDPVLTLVLVCIVPLVFAVVFNITKKSIPIYISEQETLDRLVRVVQENAAGVRVIKALSKTEHEKARFNAVSDELVAKEKKAGAVMSVSGPSTTLLLNLGLCAVIVVGAFRVNAGLSQPGKILAFLTYFTIILHAMIIMTRIYVQLSRSVASARRISEVLETTEERPILPSDPIQTDAHVLFDHVSFSYNKREDNLQDISFALKRGQTLGIIGPTGSGKSTLVQLLLRFYDPDKGAVRIDGEDIRSIPFDRLRQKFGVVFQSDFVMSATLAENMAFLRDIDREALTRAATHAQASLIINAKEGGLDAPVTSRGTNLSGGERQRVLLGRALAGDPEILILDDSSSALDYKTDLELRLALHRHYRHTTSVIIAQRVSSIKHADHILVLDDGKVIGQGTHEHLLANCPSYAEIARVQMGGVSYA